MGRIPKGYNQTINQQHLKVIFFLITQLLFLQCYNATLRQKDDIFVVKGISQKNKIIQQNLKSNFVPAQHLVIRATEDVKTASLVRTITWRDWSEKLAIVFVIIYTVFQARGEEGKTIIFNVVKSIQSPGDRTKKQSCTNG